VSFRFVRPTPNTEKDNAHGEKRWTKPVWKNRPRGQRSRERTGCLTSTCGHLERAPFVLGALSVAGPCALSLDDVARTRIVRRTMAPMTAAASVGDNVPKPVRRSSHRPGVGRGPVETESNAVRVRRLALVARVINIFCTTKWSNKINHVNINEQITENIIKKV
jgi:hypothetical protein